LTLRIVRGGPRTERGGVLCGSGAFACWICAAGRRAECWDCGGRPSRNVPLRAIVAELSLTRLAGQFNQNAARSKPKRASIAREFCPVLVMSRWGDSLKH
jgi:hypothetical protein